MRHSLVIMIVSGVGAASAATVGLLVAINLAFLVDPIQLLVLAAVGLAALGFGLFLFTTWLSRWSLVEPTALALLAIFLGAVCLAGLRMLSAPLDAPMIYGSGMLFVRADNQGPIRFEVSPNLDHDSIILDIINRSPASARWALLLIGDARLTASQTTGGVKERGFRAKVGTYTNPSLPKSVQVFSGVTGPNSFAEIDGKTTTPYIATSISREAVVLPTYGPGNLADLNGTTAVLIRSALGGSPASLSSRYRNIDVNAGRLDPSITVTQASPPLTDPGYLEWTANHPITVSFSILNQHDDDVARNYFFVLAALVGVAGAGLLASVQSAVHVATNAK
jgi:hypothetical protein